MTTRIPIIPTLGVREVALAERSKEIDRALPDSKGGEVPKSLQEYRTEIFTYTTENDPNETKLLYIAVNFVRIQLSLEIGDGPVAFGTNDELLPVLSGKGRLLNLNTRHFEAFLPKGSRFWIACETAGNRLGVTIEPIPWMEQISDEIIVATNVLQKQTAIALRLLRVIEANVNNIPAPRPAQPVPPTKPTRRMIPRLTGEGAPRKMRP